MNSEICLEEKVGFGESKNAIPNGGSSLAKVQKKIGASPFKRCPTENSGSGKADGFLISCVS